MLTSLSSSAVLGEQIYGPYGNQRYTQGTMGTDKGYTGQFQDAATGLDYYNARYYDPVMGQFLSADSVQSNAQGMDPYAYVDGNPATATDPTGQAGVCAWCGDTDIAPGSAAASGTYPTIPTCSRGYILTGTSCSPEAHTKPPTPKQNIGGGGDCGSGTTWNGNKCVADGSDCGSGTTWNGNKCVAKPDPTVAKNKARSDKLNPAIFLSVGLLTAGVILIFITDAYAIKSAIDDADIPAIIASLADIVSGLSEVASALSLVSAGIAAIAYGLLTALHGVLAIANGVLGAYNAVMAGFSWMKGVLQPALKLINITIQGAPDALFEAASEFFGKAIVTGGRALGHALMATGNAGLTEVAHQKSMNVDDWCTQFGQGLAGCAS